MVTQQKYTIETVQVFPVDMKRLNEQVDKDCHEKDGVNANTTYRVVDDYAIIREPKLAIIDKEFVGGDFEKSVTFDIHKETKKSDGGFTFTMFPVYNVTLTLAELETYLKPAITLAEFTKARRGYNSRIRSNETIWLKHLNS